MSKYKLPKIKTIRRLLQWAILLLSIIAVLGLLQPTLWPGGFGMGKEQSVTTRSVETVVEDAQGNTIKTVETTKNDDGKTLWDWLSLLGVPTSLAILGYRLQQLQQKRAEVLAKEQRNRDEALANEQRQISADETKEEVLQVYFDRLSVLLVDKNLLAIAAKSHKATDEERELLASALDVIRARTLSILRRFENDSERKTCVMRFLIEANFVSQLKLTLGFAKLSKVKLSDAQLSKAKLFGADLRSADLSGADLSGAKLNSSAKLNSADLNGADLSGADLSGADLSGADLSYADLSYADLSGANLSDAQLSHAKLSHAKLIKAKLVEAKLFRTQLFNVDLSDADLNGANFSHANLSHAQNLTIEQLQKAKLCDTTLPKRITLNWNRDCKALGISEN
jgi:uncharacterized protein YjbI with pentapeptide repeats